MSDRQPSGYSSPEVREYGPVESITEDTYSKEGDYDDGQGWTGPDGQVVDGSFVRD